MPIPFEPTTEQRRLVADLVAFALTAEQIATLVVDPRTSKQISRRSLYRHFRREMAVGAPKANAEIAGALFRAAKRGNVVAQIFWLKTRAGWREVQYVQVIPTPGEMTTEQLDEAIERAQADIAAREAAESNVASLAAYRKKPPLG
jgi:hypothetical protein